MSSPTGPPMSTTGVVLLVLTVLTWVMLSGVLSSVIGADGTGDRDISLGLRWILAGILVCALWGWLGGLLLMAGGQGNLPACNRRWENRVALCFSLSRRASLALARLVRLGSMLYT